MICFWTALAVRSSQASQDAVAARLVGDSLGEADIRAVDTRAEARTQHAAAARSLGEGPARSREAAGSGRHNGLGAGSPLAGNRHGSAVAGHSQLVAGSHKPVAGTQDATVGVQERGPPALQPYSSAKLSH